ncbi:electron transport complex subunit RsxG [Glaciecola sp. 2405UD65-10]|uniref:electron transport complex subunit RsxG n=1 Tax=Glaciecola sp. 2405UD65-10 TaxID=3397244 RepID=UPI003B5AE3FB
MIETIRKNGIILGAFALVTTSVLALTYNLTFERIELAKERQLLDVLNQVIDPSIQNNELHVDCITIEPENLLGNETQRVFRARLNGEPSALILETTATNGYSGPIKMVVAVDKSASTVLGVRVVEHKETPGLGDKIDIRVSNWIKSFNNVKYSDERADRWQVKKDGGQFDQFTGATITPRAVVRAVANTTKFAQENLSNLFLTPSNCSPGPQKGELDVNVSSSQELGQ